MTSWTDRIAGRNAEIRSAGRWRSVRTLAGAGPDTSLAATGAAVVSFASNDYLGLSQHPGWSPLRTVRSTGSAPVPAPPG